MFGSSRKGPRGLRFWVLHMLRRGPKNGAEIMDEMEHLSQGWWRPSPGSLYPLLEELASEGAIRKLSDGRYELTEKAGDDFSFLFGGFGRSPKSVPEIVSEVRGYVSYLEDVGRSDSAALASERPSIRELADRLAILGK